MVHCSATHGDAFEATTRSVGCASALLPRISAKAIATWFRKEEKAASNSKAESNCATHAPLVLEVDSTLSGMVDSRCDSTGSNEELVKMPTLSDDEVWAEMRRRFRAAHKKDAQATRASSDGAVVPPVQSKARPQRAPSQPDLMWGPPPWQM
ncbi:hypothetical protein T484DRAFT_3383251 [Baffinella frigidus]|nr:hypothetical protein T484DRAFT_3383251 [Cryptophyta sp. CCMP2293]